VGVNFKLQILLQSIVIMEDYEAFMQEANATHTGWEFLNEDYIFQDIVASGWFYIMASFVTLAITAIFVGLRLYTRIWLTRFFGWDDSKLSKLFAMQSRS
jgi:hypothetical protein